MSQNGHTVERERVRLDSWKEIAEYLERDVRTVLRWERDRGLPVHTVPSGRRRSVYAWKDELDAWMAGPASDGLVSHGEVGPEALNEGEAASDGHAGSRLRLRIRIAALLALAAAAVLGLNAMRPRSPLASVGLYENEVRASREDGSIAWTHEFSGNPRKFQGSRIVPARFRKSDGCAAFVVTAGSEGANAPNSAPTESKLHCFTGDGQILWEGSFTHSLRFGAREYSGVWGFRALHFFVVDGEPRIATSQAEFTWWPSIVTVYNFNGVPLHRFVNAGWVLDVESLERASGTFLLASGVSNSSDGGMMAVLDAKNPAGASPEARGSEYECHNCPPGRPLKYFVFPRSELNVVTGAKINQTGADVVSDGLYVRTLEAELNNDGISAVYEFSRDLELMRASYEDRYWELHRTLELDGKLTHSREACPERYGPPLIRLWEPATGWREIRVAPKK